MADFWSDNEYSLESPYDLGQAVGYAKLLAWLFTCDLDDEFRQMWQLTVLTRSVLPKYVDSLGVRRPCKPLIYKI